MKAALAGGLTGENVCAPGGMYARSKVQNSAHSGGALEDWNERGALQLLTRIT